MSFLKGVFQGPGKVNINSRKESVFTFTNVTDFEGNVLPDKHLIQNNYLNNLTLEKGKRYIIDLKSVKEKNNYLSNVKKIDEEPTVIKKPTTQKKPATNVTKNIIKKNIRQSDKGAPAKPSKKKDMNLTSVNTVATNEEMFASVQAIILNIVRTDEVDKGRKPIWKHWTIGYSQTNQLPPDALRGFYWKVNPTVAIDIVDFFELLPHEMNVMSMPPNNPKKSIFILLYYNQ